MLLQETKTKNQLADSLGKFMTINFKRSNNNFWPPYPLHLGDCFPSLIELFQIILFLEHELFFVTHFCPTPKLSTNDLTSYALKKDEAVRQELPQCPITNPPANLHLHSHFLSPFLLSWNNFTVSIRAVVTACAEWSALTSHFHIQIPLTLVLRSTGSIIFAQRIYSFF